MKDTSPSSSLELSLTRPSADPRWLTLMATHRTTEWTTYVSLAGMFEPTLESESLDGAVEYGSYRLVQSLGLSAIVQGTLEQTLRRFILSCEVAEFIIWGIHSSGMKEIRNG